MNLYNDGCAGLIAEDYGDQNAFTAGKAAFFMGSTSGLPFVRVASKKPSPSRSNGP